jgi:hypothetical protein
VKLPLPICIVVDVPDYLDGPGACENLGDHRRELSSAIHNDLSQSRSPFVLVSPRCLEDAATGAH